MPLFTTSVSAIQQPGVFIIELAAPVIIDGVSNGYVGLVFQGPWGPVNQLYKPTSAADMINTYFPPGTTHTSTGYYATMRRKQVPWAMNRILGGSQGLQPPVVTATVVGTPGSTSYTYRVVAKNGTGATIGSNVVVVTTGNATLTSGNKITLSWAAITGATSYDVYRTASAGSPGSTGKIGNTATATLDDTGLAGDSSPVPTTNASGWAQGVCYLNDSGGNTVGIITSKYAGVLPNTAMTATVAAATDGVANHFKLTITMSDSVSGSSSEIYDNLSVQATQVFPSFTSSILASAFATPGTPTTRPANGSYSFSGGSDGAAISANDYNGGLSNLATDDTISVVCVDDCGDSIRAAVNANVQAHVDAKTNRICILQGNPSNALAAVLTDVANYRDDRVIYCGAWVNALDDNGVEQRTPFATFIASAIVNLEPQQSHAWWDDRVTTFYNGISSIVTTALNPADDGTRNQCTTNGVCLPIRLDSGKYAALHDRTASLTTSRLFAVTRRIKDYLAKSIRQGIPSWVNGPNTIDQQQSLRQTVDDFLSREEGKGRIARNAATPTQPGYSIDTRTGNTSSSIALGQFFMTINATTPAPMEKIIIQMNVGPTVTITAP